MGENSLLVVSGPQHKYLRGLLAPAFSPEAVSRYTPQIAQLVTRHLADWAAAGPQGVRGMDAIKLLTFEFIVEVREGEGGREGRRPRCVCLCGRHPKGRERWVEQVGGVSGLH